MRMCLDKVLIFWTGGKNVAILNVHISYMRYEERRGQCRVEVHSL
jgi:hypothetical protein